MYIHTSTACLASHQSKAWTNDASNLPGSSAPEETRPQVIQAVTPVTPTLQMGVWKYPMDIQNSNGWIIRISPIQRPFGGYTLISDRPKWGQWSWGICWRSLISPHAKPAQTQEISFLFGSLFNIVQHGSTLFRLSCVFVGIQADCDIFGRAVRGWDLQYLRKSFNIRPVS